MSTTFLDLPDLAAEGVGGAAILCNDEFFAEKENLLKPAAAVWKDHLYTDRGKWMDGWETRRRREAGHDWCVVRLGMPGAIRGVVVDTAFFRGNFPESCRLFATAIDDPLDLRALDAAVWTEILPRTTLQGDHKNAFPIAYDNRFTHVRLEIFPDGGVARLRVHGDVRPDWARLRSIGGPIDLAALEHGAVVETCSDMFFGSRNNLIKPGPSLSMADGWETRRRRGPGNDWAIVRLAAPGTIERVELDTTHFKGNAPGRCILEGGATNDGPWRTLVESPLQPHRRHVFDAALRRLGAVAYLRLSVFPDGGIARLRAWGDLEPVASPGLASLNALPASEARATLTRCCASTAWVDRVLAARPFEDLPALLRIAERAWFAGGASDIREAFAGHPKIGETGDTHGEQAAAANPAAQIAAELARSNAAYLARHGFIFITCAQGRSAEAMLAELRARIDRTTDEELRTGAEEQIKITRLRLARLIGELA